MSRQCELVGLSRSSFYYQPRRDVSAILLSLRVGPGAEPLEAGIIQQRLGTSDNFTEEEKEKNPVRSRQSAGDRSKTKARTESHNVHTDLTVRLSFHLDLARFFS